MDGVFRHLPAIAFATVAVAVLAFSRGWTDGRLTLDGPGVAMHARIALDSWFSSGRVPYWLSEMWAGTPLWGLAPSLPTLELVPLAALVGPEPAVRIVTVGAQIVGGWGAFVLAASLWGRRTPAALVAGIVYGLHPLFITHGTLFGHETSVWVMAATPWLAWSFRRMLQTTSRRPVAVTALVAAFAVLHQAEHAYSLVVMCALMLAVEVARVRRSCGGPGVAPLLVRAGVAALLALGCIAFWLLPFLAQSKTFVLTPPALAREDLVKLELGHEPGKWLTRSGELSGAPTFEALVRDIGRNTGFGRGTFYMSSVCVALTVTTILLAGRRDRDGHLTAILLASGIGVWLSTGGVSLGNSQLVERRQALPLAVIGLVTGLLVWTFLRRLDVSRPLLAGAGVLVFLVLMPYLTPFLFLQSVLPFLSNIRFPRFYPLCALALALGAAYPVFILQGWAHRTNRGLAPLVAAVTSVAVLGIFLVDIAPYRSYYRLRPPDGDAAYARAAETLESAGEGFRVAPVSFGDPRPSSELLKRGQQLSVGWPHPMASAQLWRLTAETFIAPPSWRETAFGLSGTAYLTIEQFNRGGDVIETVQLYRNPAVRPLVRAYDRALVVGDAAVTPELAVALSTRNIAVVEGDAGVGRSLGDVALGTVGADACRAVGALPGGVAGEVAMACALHRWVGVGAGVRTTSVGESGAVFEAPLDGLWGVSVWLDRPAFATELVLRTLGPDGSFGEEVARVAGVQGRDPRDMAVFTFPPLERSAGNRYVFTLACARCGAGDEPRMLVTDADRGPGNLVASGGHDRDRVAAFTLLYDGMPAAEPPATTVWATAVERGSWALETSGPTPSVVMVAEARFPGWEARVDGQRRPVLTVDGAFVGVAVPAGEHRVTFEFEKPAPANVGLALTGTTLVIVGLLWVLPGRRGNEERVAVMGEAGSDGPR